MTLFGFKYVIGVFLLLFAVLYSS